VIGFGVRHVVLQQVERPVDVLVDLQTHRLLLRDRQAAVGRDLSLPLNLHADLAIVEHRPRLTIVQATAAAGFDAGELDECEGVGQFVWTVAMGLRIV